MDDQTAWIDGQGTVHRLTLQLKEEKCLHCISSVCVQDFTTREDRDPIIVHGVGFEDREGSWEVLPYSNHIVVCLTSWEIPKEQRSESKKKPRGSLVREIKTSWKDYTQGPYEQGEQARLCSLSEGDVPSGHSDESALGL